MLFAKSRLLVLLLGAAALFGAGVGTARLLGDRPLPPPEPLPESLDPAASLAELQAGNRRYVASQRARSVDTGHDAELRVRLARGQHPFVTILCCADSRLSPEFIFDQAPGAIFEVRNAGNVVDDDVLASCEYAVEHLHTRLVFVLGHKGCGAIEAVHKAHGKPLHDHLKALQEHMAGIRSAVLAHDGEGSPEFLARLSRENAKAQALTLLRESEPIRKAVEQGQVVLSYGLYDMETGEVEFQSTELSAREPGR